jgi:hypothetical protein
MLEPENVWLIVMLKFGRPKPVGFRPGRMVARSGADTDDVDTSVKDHMHWTQTAGPHTSSGALRHMHYRLVLRGMTGCSSLVRRCLL